MMLGLLSLFSFLPHVSWKVIASVAAAAGIGFFVWSWDARGKEIDTLQIANSTLQANVTTLKGQIAIAQQAEQVAADRLQVALIAQSKISSIKGDAAHASTSEDGKIAPVLGRTLGALNGLRKPATTH